VYNNSLEKQVIYNNFDDFCVTFLLSRGKSSEEEESNIVGEFKVSWTVCLHEPLLDVFIELHICWPSTIVYVRVCICHETILLVVIMLKIVCLLER
jgi:hypothetical protein